MVKIIFVVGLDDFHLAQLQEVQSSDQYRFHTLLSYQEIKRVKRFPVQELLEHAQRVLLEFDGTVDAVIGFWDFPVSTTLPLIRDEIGLEGPSLISVLKCEHKYWSRLLQKEVIPELVPPFQKIYPFREDAVAQCTLDFPFWLKPVKSVLSHLGFLIRDTREFETSLDIIRKNIARYAEPFNLILSKAELPEGIRAVDGYHCIAEGLISHGQQCTLEGYVYKGSVHIYGVIDSLRDSIHSSTFTRYQYPSNLPADVQHRMIEATQKVMVHIGYDNAPFNIEFYWNEDKNTIHLLEINTRISKSHCPLFKLVDGEYHHKVLIDLALGQRPDFPYRQGPMKVAAKFMVRAFQDGRVVAVPGKKDIRQVEQKFPGTEVLVHIQEGMRLSELFDQDSYSFEIAALYMGADSHEQLSANYQTALAMLPFKIESHEDR
ncbi:ATP-grasp domain-containing protein [Desulfosediminicola ganghwensis]|uniref:ATP-grasp domain-containing protein n=1 Tax=Desulfosediminicola ganghwensis TaxID=2569540 RepID=UPI0010ACD5BC|nr:ATP-grasp domain-containing protein [Desulfosediminicola ganghwensis]